MLEHSKVQDELTFHPRRGMDLMHMTHVMSLTHQHTARQAPALDVDSGRTSSTERTSVVLSSCLNESRPVAGPPTCSCPVTLCGTGAYDTLQRSRVTRLVFVRIPRNVWLRTVEIVTGLEAVLPLCRGCLWGDLGLDEVGEALPKWKIGRPW